MLVLWNLGMHSMPSGLQGVKQGNLLVGSIMQVEPFESIKELLTSL